METPIVYAHNGRYNLGDYDYEERLSLVRNSVFGKPGRVCFYLTLNPKGILSSVLREYIQDADVCQLITNFLEDDDTENYYVEYRDSRLDAVAFIHANIRNHPTKGWSYFGSRFYRKPVSLYCDVCTIIEENLHSNTGVGVSEKQNYIDVLNKWFAHEGIPFDGSNVPYCKTYCQFDWRSYGGFIGDWVYRNLVSKEEYEKNRMGYLNHSVFDKYYSAYDAFVRQLSIDGKLSTRWKNENKLFAFISRIFPEALFQNSPDWLGQLTLDVYLPIKKVAVEYQGLQHYEPVGVFGGNEGFEMRHNNDEWKKYRCKMNGVVLIEWKYTRKFTDSNLNELYEMIENRQSGVLE